MDYASNRRSFTESAGLDISGSRASGSLQKLSAEGWGDKRRKRWCTLSVSIKMRGGLYIAGSWKLICGGYRPKQRTLSVTINCRGTCRWVSSRSSGRCEDPCSTTCKDQKGDKEVGRCEAR